MCTTGPGFLYGCWGPDSGPHNCTARVSPTEQPPEHLLVLSFVLSFTEVQQMNFSVGVFKLDRRHRFPAYGNYGYHQHNDPHALLLKLLRALLQATFPSLEDGRSICPCESHCSGSAISSLPVPAALYWLSALAFCFCNKTPETITINEGVVYFGSGVPEISAHRVWL